MNEEYLDTTRTHKSYKWNDGTWRTKLEYDGTREVDKVKPHDIIYLQWDDPDEGVTWCQDSINNIDIIYIRHDLYLAEINKLKEQNKEMLEALKEIDIDIDMIARQIISDFNIEYQILAKKIKAIIEKIEKEKDK